MALSHKEAEVIGIPGTAGVAGHVTVETAPARREGLPQVQTVPPEIEAIMMASREIEKDYLAERELSRQLAEQISALQSQLQQERETERVIAIETDSSQSEAHQQLRQECEALRADIQGLRQALSQLRSSIPGGEEIQSLQEANQRLFERYLNESKKVQKLEIHIETNEHVKQAKAELESEKRRFKQTAAQLFQELEYLRSVFPVRSLLSAKLKELETVERALNRLPARHPDRKTIEALAQGHREEKDHLAGLVQRAEDAYQRQSDKIKEAIRAGDMAGDIPGDRQ